MSYGPKRAYFIPINKLNSNKRAGYDVSTTELKKTQKELSEMKSDVAKYKKELTKLAKEAKKTVPPITSVKFEEHVRKVAMTLLKERGLRATDANFKQAMIDARNQLRKDFPDIWGTQVKSGKQAVPFYQTETRMPKP